MQLFSNYSKSSNYFNFIMIMKKNILLLLLQSLLCDYNYKNHRISSVSVDALSNTIVSPSSSTHKLRNKHNLHSETGYINPIDIPYSSAIQVLQTYKALFGNLALPRRYILPSTEEDNYPPEWHGIDISRTIYDMKWWQKHVHSHPDRVTELNKLGFLWERLQPEWNLVLQALVVYKSLYPSEDESLLVPVSFVVPCNKKYWPQSTWGLHLGNQVYRVRSRQDFIKQYSTGRNSHTISDNRISQLNGLGFVWDVQEYNFQKVIDALTCYKRVQVMELRQQPSEQQSTTIMKVPCVFTVPHNTSFYPIHLWGFPLGAKCCAIRSKQLYIKNYPQRKKILEDIGFNFKGNSVLGWLDVVHAAAIYSKLHNGGGYDSNSRRGLCVPQNFVIPEPSRSSSCDWPWPGQRVRDIKSKGRYLTGKSAPSRKAQLDALGFDLFDHSSRKIKTKVVT